MEKLLFKKERYRDGTSILTSFKSLFVPFRYAPLHKERFKNRKLYLGLKIKCKFVTGLRIKKCKLKSGRDKVKINAIRQWLHNSCHQYKKNPYSNQLLKFFVNLKKKENDSRKTR